MEPYVLVDKFVELLDATHHLRNVLNTRVRMHTGLNLNQVVILQRIAVQNGAITVSELAVQSSRAPHTLTSMINGLENAGLVSRNRRVGNDRRQVHLSLTPEGIQKLRQFHDSVQQVLAPFNAQILGQPLHQTLEELSTVVKDLIPGASEN